MNQPKRIAIVGGGTAGLSAALRLRERGYDDVTVFEGSAQVGGKARAPQGSELGWLRDELSLPLEQWVKKLQLAPLAAMWEPVVDMGYGPYSEVAALYFIYFRLCTPRHGIRSLLMQKLQGGAERPGLRRC
ncbi:FAD-dependent oxidoreductase [Mycobacterium ulcerans]|uniref:FAD-dependent oxidoreductase n=1 Tax=Mycobacterium ulcerans TaxID=1809 RepID=A0ABY3V928_MYCUL|nr:FAD-dependent oxidoreductase [Mycobacterium ulcerans]MEB3907179.1 FAD-dependent oxidoreductase [Mycobacterium ulcerans]MEB3911314.1 FAD-dependent oxidoreductase [Mycobacterium ulcerans]MEB3921553.1 FAD-dependent oxidoreductase [Mycobacterium ulcerans]MEB3925687.1 FAD-dependent oxidoreductase [Mycobacterium ulcerans]MEB3929814.1 FAD-dependent oxidoreductase [Mycobacterium ulcerans]